MRRTTVYRQLQQTTDTSAKKWVETDPTLYGLPEPLADLRACLCLDAIVYRDKEAEQGV